MLFGISLLLWHCEREENFIETTFKTPISVNAKTVSFEDAKNFFIQKNNDINYLNKGTNSLVVSPDWNSLSHNEISYTDALLTKANTDINREGNYTSELFFIKVDGEMKNVIFTIWKDKVDTNGHIINARVFFNKTDGTFLDAYKIENGKFTKRLVPRKNKSTQKAGFLILLQSSDPGGCWNTNTLAEFDDGILDEVVLYTDSNGGGAVGGDGSALSYYDIINNASAEGNNNDPWSGGSGGSNGDDSITDSGITSGAAAILTIPPDGNGNCPEGFVKDNDGNCVQDPCKNIKTQINATGFKAKIELLKTKTGLKKETGFAQNKDGTFDPLAVSSSGHQLSMPSGPNRIGYLHTHLNNYLNGKFDKDGNPKEVQPIRILSPGDINTFLVLVKNAKSTGYPTSNIFGTMVSSAGTYTIRFTGDTSNINNVKTNYTKKEMEALSKIFRDKYVGKWGKERGLLKYLKHKIGVTGISLYKIKANGRIRPLTLVGDKEKLERGDCEY